MRKDPLLVLSDSFLALAEALRSLGSEDQIERDALHIGLLGSYEGYDILEVVCREAAVLTAYDCIKERVSPYSPRYEHYLKHVAQSARKYAASSDWPTVETCKAAAFGDYVEGK